MTGVQTCALPIYLRDHSLYVAFAPLEQPRIALAVIVENAGWGSAAAAPIARRVFDYLLMGQYPSADDIAATQKGQSVAPIGSPRPVDSVPLPQVTGNAVMLGVAGPVASGAAPAASAAASASTAALAASSPANPSSAARPASGGTR